VGFGTALARFLVVVGFIAFIFAAQLGPERFFQVVIQTAILLFMIVVLVLLIRSAFRKWRLRQKVIPRHRMSVWQSRPDTTEPNEYRSSTPTLPADFESRAVSTLEEFEKAKKYYFELGDERNALHSLFLAVDSTLVLLCLSEGLSVYRADNPRRELNLVEKAKRLVYRGWVRADEMNHFRRLQYLRNRAAHPEGILYKRITNPAEVKQLLNYFEGYVYNTINRLSYVL
jgi:hypothetical protein